MVAATSRLSVIVSRPLHMTALASIALAASAAMPAQALTFNFNFSNVTGPNASNAIAGYQQAGQIWSNLLSDNITVNIAAGFNQLAPGVIAQAGSESVGAFYTDVRTSLTADVMSLDDGVAVVNLPVGTPGTFNVGTQTNPVIRTLNGLSFITNNAFTGARFIDNNQTGNNLVLDVNRANAKALGLLSPNDANNDAAITFSSSLNFDFDRSNGIASNAYDFVGVAVHEIGHALGFVSGVDTVDIFSEPDGPDAPINLDNSRVFSVLDLYRYSAESIAAGGEVLDLAYGGTPFFSIDGATNMGPFSTGAFNGDGRQASHWKDNLGLGIMDPTLGFGEFATITNRDLRAFDVIGYNLAAVPEPTSLGLLGLAALATLRRRRIA
jgi:hypothetical protein